VQVVIFGSTKERAFNKWQDILNNMRFGDVDKVSMADGVFVLTNGDVYKAVTGNDGARGYRCDYAYIDRFMSVDIMDKVIIPCLKQENGSFEFF
jgi:hypothetical protein